MPSLAFDRDFDVPPGRCDRLSPLVRRVLCGNASPFTFRGTSSFIVGRGRVAVIDPGPDDPGHLAALLAATRGETVSHILVTHSHMDHTPLARALQQRTGALICAAALAEMPADGTERLDASIDRALKPDHLLAAGETIAGETWSLETLATPGHMSNHLCFALSAEKALFTGDHVMAWATSVIAPPDGHMGDYLASLRLLLARDDAVYHPAHGPSRAAPLPLVRGMLAHRQMREAAILRRITAGDREVADVVRAIYADIDPRLHAAAALSAQAHLSHLMEQGRIRETEPGRYEAVAN